MINDLGKINKRLVLVLMLSAILILFGSIPLTSLSYWKKSTHPIHPETYLALHSVKRVSTHTPTPIPTAIPTQVTVHAPMLNYPLFNGNTRIREIALTFDDGPNPYYTPQVLAISTTVWSEGHVFRCWISGCRLSQYRSPGIQSGEYNSKS